MGHKQLGLSTLDYWDNDLKISLTIELYLNKTNCKRSVKKSLKSLEVNPDSM